MAKFGFGRIPGTPNEAGSPPSTPIDIDANLNQVAENAANGTVVGITASSTDPDVGDTVTYSLVGSAGGRFAIDSNTGVVTVANSSLLDYDTDPSHDITVRATSNGGTAQQTFTINLTPVDEAPSIPVDVNVGANQVAENAANGTTVGITVSSTDPDSGHTVTYSLTDDAGGRFTIDPNTGVVTVANGTLLNFEDATFHQITVRATSSVGGLFSEQNFTINVTAVNEGPSVPVDADDGANTVVEGAANGTTVGITAQSTDPDASDPITYSLTDDAGGRFAIDANTGVVTVANGTLLDFDTNPSHNITVRATSSGGLFAEQTFTINVTQQSTVIPFATDGSNVMNWSNRIAPTSLYVPSTQKLHVAWERWDAAHSRREGWARTIDLSADPAEASPPFFIADNPLNNDPHGNPAIQRDHEGYFHYFTGADISPLQYWTSLNPDQPAPVIERASPLDESTYPHCHLVGTALYLYAAWKVQQSPPQSHLLMKKTTSLSGGVAVWNAGDSLVDFGLDARLYAGKSIVRGTEIWIPVAWANGTPATPRRHLYLFRYDTVDGSVKNLDGSVTRAAGTLPILLAEANQDFRLIDSGTTNENAGAATSLVEDEAGNVHFTYRTGADGWPNGKIMHMVWDGVSLSTPFEVGTCDEVDDPATVGRDSAGGIQVIWVEDPSATHFRSGTPFRRARSAAGVWGAKELVRAIDTKPFSALNSIQDGPASARLTYCENSEVEFGQDFDAIAGNLKGYILGDDNVHLPFVVPEHTISDVDAAAYVARMSASPSSGEKWMIEQFFKALKTKIGLAKFDALYLPFFASVEADALLNVVQNQYNLTKNGAITFTPNKSFTGDGSTGWLDTGFNPTTAVSPAATADNQHIGMFSNKQNDNESHWMGNTACWINGSSGGNVFNGRLATGGFNFGTSTDDTGHYVITKPNQNNVRGFKDGSFISQESPSDSSFDNSNYAILRQGPTGAFSDQEFFAAHWGANLSDTEVKTLYSIIYWSLRQIGHL
jgi:hypothetical protein